MLDDKDKPTTSHISSEYVYFPRDRSLVLELGTKVKVFGIRRQGKIVGYFKYFYIISFSKTPTNLLNQKLIEGTAMVVDYRNVKVWNTKDYVPPLVKVYKTKTN